LGCDQKTVYESLDAAAIPRRRPQPSRPRPFPELDDHAWLRRRYLDGGRSQRELAGEIGCSIRAVRRAFTKAQIPSRPQGQHTKHPAKDSNV